MDTPRGRVLRDIERFEGGVNWGNCSPDTNAAWYRLRAALTEPQGCEGKWRYHVEVIDGFQYNIYEKLTEKVNSFLASHDVVQVATGCERGRPTYSIVYRTPEEGENV